MFLAVHHNQAPSQAPSQDWRCGTPTWNGKFQFHHLAIDVIGLGMDVIGLVLSGGLVVKMIPQMIQELRRRGAGVKYVELSTVSSFCDCAVLNDCSNYSTVQYSLCRQGGTSTGYVNHIQYA